MLHLNYSYSLNTNFACRAADTNQGEEETKTEEAEEAKEAEGEDSADQTENQEDIDQVTQKLSKMTTSTKGPELKPFCFDIYFPFIMYQWIESNFMRLRLSCVGSKQKHVPACCRRC